MLKYAIALMLLATPAHAGWEFHTDAQDSFHISYSIPLGGKTEKRECRNDYIRMGLNTVVHALTNSLVRGSSRVGAFLPTGATLSGHALGWMATSNIYGLDTGTTLSLIASDFTLEQVEGWAEELDIGLVQGDADEETLGFAKHLTRARIGSMTIIGHEAGWSSEWMKGHGAIGAVGYRAGAELKKRGKLPRSGEFKQHYRLGEVVTGAAFGYGVAKTLDCRS